MEIADLGELRATVGHAIGYLLLAFAAVMAQQAPRPWLTVVLASAYGVVLELAQGAIGLRSMQFTDVLANCVGAMAGALIGALLLRRLT